MSFNFYIATWTRSHLLWDKKVHLSLSSVPFQYEDVAPSVRNIRCPPLWGNWRNRLRIGSRLCLLGEKKVPEAQSPSLLFVSWGLLSALMENCFPLQGVRLLYSYLLSLYVSAHLVKKILLFDSLVEKNSTLTPHDFFCSASPMLTSFVGGPKSQHLGCHWRWGVEEESKEEGTSLTMNPCCQEREVGWVGAHSPAPHSHLPHIHTGGCQPWIISLISILLLLPWGPLPLPQGVHFLLPKASLVAIWNQQQPWRRDFVSWFLH